MYCEWNNHLVAKDFLKIIFISVAKKLTLSLQAVANDNWKAVTKDALTGKKLASIVQMLEYYSEFSTQLASPWIGDALACLAFLLLLNQSSLTYAPVLLTAAFQMTR